MSGQNRRHHSGTSVVFFLILVGSGLIWTSPIWMERLFPGVFIHSQLPWDLTVADLTWQRALTNVILKPGFRLWMVGAYTGLLVLTRWMFVISSNSSTRKLSQFKELLTTLWAQDSGEFVVEGRRASLLVEFAREVRAV